jgi:hypothetical protein
MTDLVVMPARAMPNALTSVKRAVSYVESISLVGTVSVLTLFLALVFGFDNAVFRIVVQISLLAVLLQPAVLRSPWLWAVIATTGTCALLDDWFVADNHKYLLVYWLWVLTIAQSFPDSAGRDRVLTGNARFFLVFIFLAAVLQKLCSPTYMSGAMFELRLLLDERFRAFAHLMGVSENLQDQAIMTMTTLKSPLLVIDGDQLNLGSSDLVRKLAVTITWYDLVVQIFIGTLFAVGRRMTDILGHFLLLFFIFTTYIPAPVFGFGWTLAILGFTASKNTFPRISLAYLSSCLAILAYQTPWREWVLSG